MYQYSNSLIRQFPSAVTGNAAVGVQATVYVGETGALASLFEVDGSSKSNPVTTDGKGFYSFSLADGDYRIVFSSSQFATLRISVLDGAQIREEFDDLVASNTAFRNEQQAAYDAFVLSQGWDQVGTFAAGFAYTSPNQVGQDVDGNWWRWNGALPKAVTAGTLPSYDANYKLVGDGVLRSDLANGAADVGGITAERLAKLSAKKVPFIELGGVPDGATDNRAAWIAALTAASNGEFTLVVTKGIYGFNNWIPPSISNVNIVFEAGAEFKLLSTTGPIGGFIIGGFDEGFAPIAWTNSNIFNMVIDCNNLVGENAFSAGNAENINLFNPVLKNCLRSDAALGGRAFQFEGGIARGINVYNPQIINCSIGINSQADPAGTYIAADINYHNVIMRNVDVPFNVDCGFANPETNTPDKMSTTIHGATLYNCGRLSYVGVSDPNGGGIFCGDRGYGLNAYNVRVINDTTYGSIGGLVRGTMFGVRLRNIVAYLTGGATAVYDFNPLGFGAPSTASHPSSIDADDITVIGNLDFVVKTKSGGGSLGPSSMTKTKINSSLATLAGICDTEAGVYINSVIEVVDTVTHEGTGVRTLAHMFNIGNSFLSDFTSGTQKTSQNSGTWNPEFRSISGTPTTMTMVVSGAEWILDGEICTATALVSTSNVNTSGMSGALIVIGLPFQAAGYGICDISFVSGWAENPTSGVVVADENFIRLQKREAGGDVTCVPGSLQAGAVANANTAILVVKYRIKL